MLAGALLSSGCQSPPPRPSPPPPPRHPYVEPQAAPIVPTPVPPPPPAPHPNAPPRENHLSPATRSLVMQARSSVAHGDLDAASITLDRALRIEPNNPLLWVERGKLRLAQNDAHQAEGCARKALALAGGDPAAQAQAGHVLLDALRAQGRNQEAAEIERQPFMH
jgi:uncharacterized protein HemY